VNDQQVVRQFDAVISSSTPRSSYPINTSHSRLAIRRLRADCVNLTRSTLMTLLHCTKSHVHPRSTGSQSGSQAAGFPHTSVDNAGSDHAADLHKRTSVDMGGCAKVALLIRGFGVRVPGGAPVFAG
jgi:hypothetical protein